MTRLAYFDMLPRDVPVLLCAHDGAFPAEVEELVKLTGLGNRAVPFTGHGRSLPVGKLHVLDWAPRDRNAGIGSPHFPPRCALRRTRERFAQLATPDRLLFVRRSAPPRRGPAELGRWLREFSERSGGWLTVEDFDGAPLRRAVRAFGRAAVVVGVHGAGLANALFMPAGGHLLELRLPQPHADYFAHLAAALDLHYWPVPLSKSAHLYSSTVTCNKTALEAALARVRAHWEKEADTRADHLTG